MLCETLKKLCAKTGIEVAKSLDGTFYTQNAARYDWDYNRVTFRMISEFRAIYLLRKIEKKGKKTICADGFIAVWDVK